MNDKSDQANSWSNPSFVSNPGGARISESLLLGERLRSKTAAGWALGTFLIELPNVASLTAIALAGFDFAVLDLEHSAIDFGELEKLLAAGQNSGLVLLVRTWGEESGVIGKVLDMGAHGIMAPHVDTPERARAVVEAARFAPDGGRGFSPLSKYDALSEPLRMLNDATFVVVQIEGKSALARVGEISAVPGIDCVFVGPYDLALSLGVAPGSEDVYEAAARVAGSVSAHVAMGIYIDDPSTCGQWAARRFALQCVGFDGRMLADGARALAEQAREGMNEQR